MSSSSPYPACGAAMAADYPIPLLDKGENGAWMGNRHSFRSAGTAAAKQTRVICPNGVAADYLRRFSARTPAVRHCCCLSVNLSICPAFTAWAAARQTPAILSSRRGVAHPIPVGRTPTRPLRSIVAFRHLRQCRDHVLHAPRFADCFTSAPLMKVRSTHVTRRRRCLRHATSVPLRDRRMTSEALQLQPGAHNPSRWKMSIGGAGGRFTAIGR